MTNPNALPSSRATTDVSAKSRHHSMYAYGELRSSLAESRAIRHSCAPSALVGDSIKCVTDILRKRNREFSACQRRSSPPRDDLRGRGVPGEQSHKHV